MKITGYHRGAHNWICEFDLDGRHKVAYLDRPTGTWMYAHMEKIDVSTRGEMNVEMTEGLKQYLESIGVIKKGEPNGQDERNENE